ncbi:MAG TPA: ion channel [Candidatus Krumholzibacteria bacterium]|nr:ion channel [Candidatus Krumholzibacteria bacterium]
MVDERQREADAQDSDLGLGTVAPSQIRRRILEKNGEFNVIRNGLSFWTSASVYHHLLNMKWPAFLAWASLGYLALNLVFAGIYTVLDVHVGALVGGDSVEGFHRFLRAFYFSVETSSTIGYGNIIPRGDFANMVVTAESFIGLLGVALMTGLVFARFSRPSANILFSEHALIAPYGDGGRGFMFRIVNGRRSQLIELQVQVILSLLDEGGETHTRRFHMLPLERERVPFFSLNWPIVHPIDERSPLRGIDVDTLQRRQAEVTVLITGMDETFSQIVHARSSYGADEIVQGARFVRMFQLSEDGRTEIDIRRLDDHEPADLP